MGYEKGQKNFPGATAQAVMLMDKPQKSPIKNCNNFILGRVIIHIKYN